MLPATFAFAEGLVVSEWIVHDLDHLGRPESSDALVARTIEAECLCQLGRYEDAKAQADLAVDGMARCIDIDEEWKLSAEFQLANAYS